MNGERHGKVGEYRVVAHNTATASANKIHDDAVARRYGFGGGLVPGVDVYAYMTRPPAEAWGIDWLRRGAMRARFVTPVYEGDEVVVVPVKMVESSTGCSVSLEVRNSASVVCAVGQATLSAEPMEAPSPATWLDVAQADEPPTASPEALVPGTSLGLASHRFHADRADNYLGEVRETLPLYADAGVAHPGWLLRDANHLLSANVLLGPWIHVESVVQHYDVVRDRDMVAGRATVTKEWENKGHRFVELDVALLVNSDPGGDRAIARITHTAIYRPRTSG